MFFAILIGNMMNRAMQIVRITETTKHPTKRIIMNKYGISADRPNSFMRSCRFFMLKISFGASLHEHVDVQVQGHG